MLTNLTKNTKQIELIYILIVGIIFGAFCVYLVKFTNPFIFIISFLIIIVLFSVLSLFFKDKFSKRLLLKGLIFPIFFILVIIISLIHINLLETKGENNTSTLIHFDLYIINNSISIDNFNQTLADANKIWKKYNITLELNKVYFKNLNETEKYFLLNVNATDSKECERYKKLINFSDSNIIKVIILDSNSSKKGRGCICGCDSIIIAREIILFKDLTGWNLAHEFGHMFGLLDLHNRYNLMCDELKIFNPTFLNKNQTKSVLETSNAKFI